jgi:hypothetical protein
MARPAPARSPWQSRIVAHAAVPPADLLPHPLNFRDHPTAQQAALEGSLDELGWIRAVTVNRRTGRILDGHLRVERALARGEATVPVEYVDLSEAEERLALAVIDPLAAMAHTNPDHLAGLLAEVTAADPALGEMLADMAHAAGLDLQVTPDEDAWPEIAPPELHSFTVRYGLDDEPAIRRFVGLPDDGAPLPADTIGRQVLERIRDLAAPGAD